MDTSSIDEPPTCQVQLSEADSKKGDLGLLLRQQTTSRTVERIQWCLGGTVDGSEILRENQVQVGKYSMFFQVFIHFRWLFGISSIRSIYIHEQLP